MSFLLDPLSLYEIALWEKGFCLWARWFSISFFGKGNSPMNQKRDKDISSRSSKDQKDAKVQTPAITSVLSRLETWLRKNRRGFYKGLFPGAKPEELSALQNKLGGVLPEDLRAFLAWHNGQSLDFIGHFEQNWNLMSADQIAAAKRELDAEDHLETGWKREWIPFMDDDAGDFLFLDTGTTGIPAREFWQGKPEQPLAAPSLAAWLESFVNAVEKGEYVEDPERGTFLRSRTN
jgi:cell wall assembly regulator SMI1